MNRPLACCSDLTDKVDHGQMDQIKEQRHPAINTQQAGKRILSTLDEGQKQKRGPDRHQQKQKGGRVLFAVDEGKYAPSRAALQRPGGRIPV